MDIKECFRINITLMVFLGVWMPEHYRGSWKEVLYKVYAVTIPALYLYTGFISQLIYFILIGDFVEMIKTSSMMLTYCCIALKQYSFITRRDRIRKMLDDLNEPAFQHSGEASLRYVTSSMATVRNTCKAYIALVSSTVLLYTCYPLTCDQSILPYPAWYPFNTEDITRIRLLWAYQTISTLLSALLDVSQETIASGMIELACGQLDVLYHKISSNKEILDNDINESGNVLIQQQQRTSATKKNLLQCVKQHIAIIRFVDEIENVFEYRFFLQVGIACVVICTIGFLLSVNATSVSLELLTNVFYMVCIVMEIYLYSIRGENLTVKSERIVEAAYSCEWYKYSQEEKKILLIIMERAKRPLSITAVFFTLSLGTFTSIMKTSYSYYTVLRQSTRDG